MCDELLAAQMRCPRRVLDAVPRDLPPPLPAEGGLREPLLQPLDTRHNRLPVLTHESLEVTQRQPTALVLGDAAENPKR